MGTVYYGVCHDCKQYIDLDKFCSWGVLPLPDDDMDDFKTDDWIFRTLRLHAFIYAHNGHRIKICSETDDSFYRYDFKEQFPWPAEEFLVINKKETRFKKLIAHLNNFFDYFQFRLQHTKRIEQALYRSQLDRITLEKKIRDLTRFGDDPIRKYKEPLANLEAAEKEQLSIY